MEAAAFDDLQFTNDTMEVNDPAASSGDAVGAADATATSTIEDSELLNTGLGQRLISAEIDREVATLFCEVVLEQGTISETEVDARVVESIRHYPSAAAIAALKEFKRCDVSGIENKFGYLFGIMRSWRHRIEAGANPDEEHSDAVRRGPEDPLIAELLQKTGFKLEIGASQRRFGPPPSWTGEQPGRDCEVYVGRVPKECLEDELVPVLERFGPLYDLRIMLDMNTRESKGYVFVTFQNGDAAKKCLEELNGFTMKPGTKPLKTGTCSPNTRIYVGNVPKHKSRDELRADLSKVVPGVTDVIVYPCADNPRKKNRGFCFVDFESHRLAGSALKRLEKISARVWHGTEIYVEWADPLEEVDPSVFEQVKTIFVNNISSDADEQQVKERFTEFGKIVELKRAKDYAFVKFEERDSALRAVEAMNNTQFGKNVIGVQLARPMTDKTREMRQQRWKSTRFPERGGFRERGRMHDRGDRGRDSSHSRKYDYDYSDYSRPAYPQSYGGAYPYWPMGGRPPVPVMPFMPLPFGMPVPYGAAGRYDRERGRDRSPEHGRERDHDRGSASRSRSASATTRKPPSTSFGGYPAPAPGLGFPPYGVMPPHPFAMPHGMGARDGQRKPPRSNSMGPPRPGDRGVKRTAVGAKNGDPTKRSRYDQEAGKSYYGGGYGASGASGYGAAGAASGDAGSFGYGGFGYGAGGPGGRNFSDAQFADDNF